MRNTAYIQFRASLWISECIVEIAISTFFALADLGLQRPESFDVKILLNH